MQEKTQQPATAVLGLLERALGTGLFDKDVDGIVALYEAAAGYLRRAANSTTSPEDEEEGAAIEPAVGLLKQGIMKISASKSVPPGTRPLFPRLTPFRS